MTATNQEYIITLDNLERK